MPHSITYKGPSGPIYTYGRVYPITRDTAYGWIVVDDQGVVTNVSKRGHVYWQINKTPNEKEST